MKTVLIIGITGFLGRNLSKILWNKYKDSYKIIGTGISPNKINLFKTIRRNWKATEMDIPCHCIDIVYDIDRLEFIFKENQIDYIIHCAALKYIDIAEKDPSKCIDINIIGTNNIIKLANKYNIKNLIALSTDKANNPINTYGMSKYLMEQLVFQNKYSVYQGVNFFWSDGSVLDIWYRQIRRKEQLCITSIDQDRYYSNIENICADIINNIDVKNQMITPTQIIKINLADLYNAMIRVFNYDSDKAYFIGKRDNEKQVEILHSNQKSEIISPNSNQIEDLIKETLKNIELSCL